MFKNYYQDELAFLREMGREFAEARPEAARFLGEAGSDPDVERLLEGFAFLTGRIRQKLDDELPELTSSMMELYFPQFLRPIPSMSILQVEPASGVDVSETVISRGTSIDSTAVGGTRCRFQTSQDLAPIPAKITAAELRTATPTSLVLRIQADAGQDLRAFASRPLSIHLAGESVATRSLLLCLSYRVASIRVDGVLRSEAAVSMARLNGDRSLLPAAHEGFIGQRLLQEYFAFPEGMSFVEVSAWCPPGAGAVAAVELEFEFSKLPDEMPPITARHFALNCVPIVNLFPHDADPVRVVLGRSEYPIRPSGDLGNYEVYNVTQVQGRGRGTGTMHRLTPFHAFRRGPNSEGRYYDVRAMESMAFEGCDHQLLLGGGDDGGAEEIETLSIELSCTNRRAAERLGVGDISHPTPMTPAGFQYRNVSRPTPVVPAPRGDDVQWRLLGQMSLNYQSLLSVESLRSLLRQFDFRSREDRQSQRQLENRLASISAVRGERGTRLQQGVPMRGIEVVLEIDEDRFGGEGELYLFGAVLSEFLSEYVTINSYSCLRIVLTGSQDEFAWPARLGAEVLL